MDPDKPATEFNHLSDAEREEIHAAAAEATDPTHDPEEHPMSTVTIPHTRLKPPDHGQVPQSIVLDGVICPVIAAVFLPGGPGELPAHVVAYRRATTGHGYATGLYVHDDERRRDRRLIEGAYDLTLTQALADVVRRLED